MNHTVLITAWNRPEFLGACFLHIQACPNWKDHDYIIAIDRAGPQFKGRRASPDNIKVIDTFIDAGAKVKVIRHNHRYNGNSYNVLEGYKYALNHGGDLIHLIEEDIFVAPDYFIFAEKAHKADPSCMFVSACRNQNRFSGYGPKGAFPQEQKWEGLDMLRHIDASKPAPCEPEQMVYNHKSYQSLAVSWTPKMLKKVVAHAIPAFYNNMPTYLKRNFPKSKKAGFHTEQDGLIYRILEKENLYGIYPADPRAYHAGWASPGYNRPGKILDKSRSLTDRINTIMNMTEEDMNVRAANPAYRDITKCEMDLSRGSTDLILIDAIHKTNRGASLS